MSSRYSRTSSLSRYLDSLKDLKQFLLCISMIYEINCIVIDNVSFFTKFATFVSLFSFRNDEIMSLSHIVALLEQGNIPSIILDNSLTSSRFHDKSSFYKTRFSAVFSIRGLSWSALLCIETLPSNYTLSSLFSRTQHCDSISFSIHSNRINLSFLVFLNLFSSNSLSTIAVIAILWPENSTFQFITYSI